MNAIWLVMSPLCIPCTCPFLTLFITSKPWSVRHAVSKEKKLLSSLTSRLMRVVILLHDVVEVRHSPQFTVLRGILSAFSSLKAFG
jgi:hypothetical protein